MSDRTGEGTGEAAASQTGPEPNPQQRRLIENTDGVYLVDAGAGTGKTFAITRRYANVVDQQDVEPADVLLLTFTRSAATEMRDRIVDHSEYGLRTLADAPISTFHAHCLDLLEEHGYDAPAHLGIDDHVTASTRLIEDDLVERSLFEEFVGRFRDANPEHRDRFRAIDDPTELLDLIRELAAKGVFPTAAGWYRDSRRHLLGDFEAFRELFDERNRPRNDGRKQSQLRSDLGGFGKRRTYLPDAPDRVELRGERGTKRVPDRVAREAFEQDRDDLADFVHDVYFGYLEFALERNVLNFAFLQLLAFVLLREDAQLRQTVACEYVMVDEFQDTSEIQFKLALLLSDADNLCVVGDWKQSIFGFHYADVDNIRAFEQRLERFSADLDGERADDGRDDGDRSASEVTFDAEAVERIELTENYRSTASILKFSERALVTPATDGETVDGDVHDDVVSLSSNAALAGSSIEAITHDREHEAVLAKIQSIVGNEDYRIVDESGDVVTPEYGDVAVLTRTRDFGRELLSVAEEYDLPLAYDGDVELFRTDPAKLLLAWLRILESDADRGWAVVLERAGYTLDEIDHLLDDGPFPAAMVAFRDALEAADSVGTVARLVFDRYGFDGETADVVLDTVTSVDDATTFTRGDLIRYVERAIENGASHPVDTGTGADSVTVQTIHAAKGLEYPIVVLANMNDGVFPPTTRNRSVLRYDEPVGLRQTRRYVDVEAHPHVYHDWRHDVLRHCLPEGYDEERRLLYVAITRAEHHVVLAGGSKPNTFLEELPVDVTPGTADVSPVERGATEQTQLPFTTTRADGPIGLSAHDLLDDDVFGTASERVDSVERGGTDFGTRVHDFAEEYAEGRPVEPAEAYDDERNVRRFLDGLDGELIAEEPAILPVDVGGDRVTVSGVVDLVHLGPTTVDVVDYKTDRTRRAQGEYRTQLSVYYHVLDAEYPDRDVTTSLYYTADDERVFLDPLSLAALEDVVRSKLG